ncbi:RNA-binding protein [Cylindrospermopsis raciborskii S07]|uniref:RNA-binding protein n=2 Tax=Cylindrospermopsis raciborskii TaxID=77022 RepID=A0A853MEB3_9CYAN|nr:DciA family protein [Cylindrospermopsis raciborskii]EFA71470.1 conserved hypothetical protein [Cylindrospermopsis raciborskii CS-505]OBU76882.1 RNA-binding protein [Cylindrospermopsis raciborskii CS-505]OHY38765.1 RNA-binding protein [Cylindrospermopsis raciborskii CS-508]PNJ97388.1 RNA-binding protein [Cylindrospermopsis raciborskii C03]PNJ99354.1 RNA-binding protein [Cylindrospermopsis raciborskii C04]
MSLKSVNEILGILQIESRCQEEPLLKLLNFWPEVVGVKVARETRPLSIRRHVLWVATSSAAWSQNLTFGRYAILLKLNQRLNQLQIPAITDIRFSTAQWNETAQNQTQETFSCQKHPSYLEQSTNINHTSQIAQPVVSVKMVFENWFRTKQVKDSHLPLCPQCHCPSPPGELERWSICSPCAAKVMERL